MPVVLLAYCTLGDSSLTGNRRNNFSLFPNKHSANRLHSSRSLPVDVIHFSPASHSPDLTPRPLPMAFDISQLFAALLELAQMSTVLLSPQPLLLFLLFPSILAIENPWPHSAGRQLELKQHEAAQATGAFLSQGKEKSFGNLMKRL